MLKVKEKTRIESTASRSSSSSSSSGSSYRLERLERSRMSMNDSNINIYNSTPDSVQTLTSHYVLTDMRAQVPTSRGDRGGFER